MRILSPETLAALSPLNDWRMLPFGVGWGRKMRESKLKMPIQPVAEGFAGSPLLMAQVHPLRLLISQICSCPDDYEAASCKEGPGDIGKESEAVPRSPQPRIARRAFFSKARCLMLQFLEESLKPFNGTSPECRRRCTNFVFPFRQRSLLANANSRSRKKTKTTSISDEA